MYFSTLTTIAILATSALALPQPVERQSPVCAGTYSNAQCCAVNALDLADLNCANPPKTPTSVTDFVNICAAEGQQAQCCALPILGQALLCESPIGA